MFLPKRTGRPPTLWLGGRLGSPAGSGGPAPLLAPGGPAGAKWPVASAQIGVSAKVQSASHAGALRTLSMARRPGGFGRAGRRELRVAVQLRRRYRPPGPAIKPDNRAFFAFAP